MPAVEALHLHYDLHAASRAGAPLVVLLHGLGSCGQDWGLQLPALTSGYRVLTPDLPGHGRSRLEHRWPTVPGMAGAVDELLESLGEADAHIVGLSLGGAVGLQLAVDYPSRVRSLTAVNTFARLRLGAGGFRRGLDRSWLALTGHMDVVGERVAAGLFPGPELEAFRRAAAARLSGNSSRTYFRLLSSVARFDLRPRLGSIRAPTLVVAGEKDTTVTLSAKTELAVHIPNARLVIVPGSGHATPLDAVDAFNGLLLGFLAEVDGAGDRTREPSRRVAPGGGLGA